ncbi:UNVERIFIED_CONTAM: hypothetical protein FKN15_074445 [Acipenser sinensis]
MDLRKEQITETEEPDSLYKNVAVLVKGHDKAVLDSYQYFATLAAQELGINIDKVGTCSKGTLCGVQDAAFSLKIAILGPGYSTAGCGREFQGESPGCPWLTAHQQPL